MSSVTVEWVNGELHPAGWRYCADIGLHAIDRSRENSCVFATAFCRETCYNRKLEGGLFRRGMATRDVSNDIFWENGDLATGLPRNVTRARLVTRGEAFASKVDVSRVEMLANARPATVFWIPTRAWRSRVLRPMLESLRARCANLRILASIDPTNSDAELEMLATRGWSVMFYGDDDRNAIRARAESLGYRYSACPKTWHHVRGACARCRSRCFTAKPSRPGFYHLKRH